jgi:nucleoside-diphosphate-sugar epimerase
MRVLLTGSSGFIGSHVARRLVGDGMDLHLLARRGSDLWRINDILPSVSVVEGDLYATEGFVEQVKRVRPEVCIHLAWNAEPGKYLNSSANIRLLGASMQLAQIAAECGCKRFIGAGTCFEYDTSLGYLSETTATRPNSLYAASKLSLALMLEQVGRLTGMQLCWLRFFYQYGPQEDARRLVPSVICSLMENRPAKVTAGQQVRDFLHVEDVAAAVSAVSFASVTGVVNVGSGQPTSVHDIVTRIGQVFNKVDLIQFGALASQEGDPPFVCANNGRLVATGWHPRYGLQDGIEQTISWWRQRTGKHRG